MAQLEIVVDDRARLLSAVLAATRWPSDEQAIHRHRAHLHARQTAERAQFCADHPAVRRLQTLLDEGASLDDLYGYALGLSWPDLEPGADAPPALAGWHAELRDFLHCTDLAAWWQAANAPWQAACAQAEAVTGGATMSELLDAFCGMVPERLCFMPNISYPSERPVGALVGDALYCLAPPPVAWGDNEPWPFDDDAVYVRRSAFSEYARVLMTRHLRAFDDGSGVSFAQDDLLLRLFVTGAVAVFLEQAVSPREAGAYVLMERRVNDLAALPDAVDLLKTFLVERQTGHRRHFLDYLPHFSAFVASASTMSPSESAGGAA